MTDDYLKELVGEEYIPLEYSTDDLTTWEKAVIEDFPELELTPTDMVIHRPDSPVEPDAVEPVAACAGNSICVKMQTSTGRILRAPPICSEHLKLLVNEYIKPSQNDGKDNRTE